MGNVGRPGGRVVAAVSGLLLGLFSLASCTSNESDGETQPVAVVVDEGELASEEVGEAIESSIATTQAPTATTEKESAESVESADATATTNAESSPEGPRVLDIVYTVEDSVISGQVLEGGEPVSNIEVRLKDPETIDTLQVWGTDLEGRYRFGPLEPGCYMTKAYAPDDAAWAPRYQNDRHAIDYMCIDE